MSTLTSDITFAGQLAADPELRFTNGGVAVANFRVIVNTRAFDQEAKEWKDTDATGLTCKVFRAQAEHVASTLGKGDRVIVNGTLRTEHWQTEAGESRSAVVVEVTEIGASLLRAHGQLTRVTTADTSDAAPVDPWADGGEGV